MFSNYPSSIPNDEYEAQLFQVSCTSVIDGVKSYVSDVIQEQATEVTDKIRQSGFSSDEVDDLLNKAKADLTESYLNSSKRPLEILSAQMPNFFGLPPHILLHDDEVQRGYGNKSHEKREHLLSEMDQLRSKIRRARFLKAFLLEELNLAKKMEESLAMLDGHEKQLTTLSVEDSKEKLHDFHKISQNILGVEVMDASLKLSERKSCSGSNLELGMTIMDTYEHF